MIGRYFYASDQRAAEYLAHNPPCHSCGECADCRREMAPAAVAAFDAEMERRAVQWRAERHFADWDDESL